MPTKIYKAILFLGFPYFKINYTALKNLYNKEIIIFKI